MAIYIAQASVLKWPLVPLRQAKIKTQRTRKIHKPSRKQLHTTKTVTQMHFETCEFLEMSSNYK